MAVNEALAERFDRIARLLELLGEDKFRVIAHQRAARTIEGLSFDIATIASDKKKLLEIEGIGPKIADKIIEFVGTGQIKELDALDAKVPRGVAALMDIPGLGPKTAAVLWKEAGITDLASLKKIIENGSILTLPRMGEKSVEKLKASMALADEGTKRLRLGIAALVADRVIGRLKTVKGVGQIEFAGSLRRGKETIGDIDILATAKNPAAASEVFRTMPEVRQVITAGDTRSSVRISTRVDAGRWGEEGGAGAPAGGDAAAAPADGAKVGPTVQVDLRIVPEESWGAAMMYFTGSKEHNVRLRERALKQKLTLNEYGLYPLDKSPEPPQKRGVKAVAGKTEEEVFKVLGLPYIPPEIREDRGELTLTKTPELITIEDIKSELHAHTTASDGRLIIEELAARAKERGFHTIAVTDHSKSSFQAGGLTVPRLMEHIEDVRRVAATVKGITVLAGSEVDILSDGSLDYDDDVLKQLDVVVASPHAALSQGPDVATRRLIAAIKHPYVHIIGHPTGRMINRRSGLSPDMSKLVAAAKEYNTALEINAHWMRLDLRDTHVRAAVDAGCLIAIDCDVHEVEDFDNLRFGVATARRGWVTAESCVNTWGAKKLHAWLKSKR